MEIEKIKITDITPSEYNPRKISDEDYTKLKNSLNTFGLIDPIIVNLKNMHIVGGHQRYEVLLDEHMQNNEFLGELPMVRLGDVGFVFTDTNLSIKDEDHEKALNLALNKINGEWDLPKLESVLDDLEINGFDLEVTGFDLDDLSNIDDELGLDDLEPDEVNNTKEDEYEESVEEIETNIKLGNLYQLGDHYLLCGDATQEKDLEKLLNNVKVDSIVTDPPYGVDYNNKNEFLNKYDKGNRIQKEIQNDNITDYKEFFKGILNNIVQYLNEYNTLYIFMSSKELHSLRLAIEDVKDYHWGDYLVWVKNNHILGRKDYNSKLEFILYAWYKKHVFYGDSSSTTVLEFNKPVKNDLHPTMKPIPLLGQLISDGTPENGVVLDLFGGSGSTLIACEQLDRKCYMMEIDPQYCQTIINRLVSFKMRYLTK